MTKLLICLYIIGSFYFHLKDIMYMTNNVLGLPVLTEMAGTGNTN